MRSHLRHRRQPVCLPTHMLLGHSQAEVELHAFLRSSAVVPSIIQRELLRLSAHADVFSDGAVVTAGVDHVAEMRGPRSRLI